MGIHRSHCRSAKVTSRRPVQCLKPWPALPMLFFLPSFQPSSSRRAVQPHRPICLIKLVNVRKPRPLAISISASAQSTCSAYITHTYTFYNNYKTSKLRIFVLNKLSNNFFFLKNLALFCLGSVTLLNSNRQNTTMPGDFMLGLMHIIYSAMYRWRKHHHAPHYAPTGTQ